MKYIYTVFAILVGVSLLILGYNQHTDDSELRKFGVEVWSEPIYGFSKNVQEGKPTTYTITPQFKTKSGASYNCVGEIASSTVDQLKNSNRKIKIRYLSNNPRNCIMEGANGRNTWVVTLIGAFLTLFGIAYLYQLIANRRA